MAQGFFYCFLLCKNVTRTPPKPKHGIEVRTTQWISSQWGTVHSRRSKMRPRRMRLPSSSEMFKNVAFRLRHVRIQLFIDSFEWNSSRRAECVCWGGSGKKCPCPLADEHTESCAVCYHRWWCLNHLKLKLIESEQNSEFTIECEFFHPFPETEGQWVSCSSSFSVLSKSGHAKENRDNHKARVVRRTPFARCANDECCDFRMDRSKRAASEKFKYVSDWELTAREREIRKF